MYTKAATGFFKIRSKNVKTQADYLEICRVSSKTAAIKMPSSSLTNRSANQLNRFAFLAYDNDRIAPLFLFFISDGLEIYLSCFSGFKRLTIK